MPFAIAIDSNTDKTRDNSQKPKNLSVSPILGTFPCILFYLYISCLLFEQRLDNETAISTVQLDFLFKKCFFSHFFPSTAITRCITLTYLIIVFRHDATTNSVLWSVIMMQYHNKNS